ncbi:MAG: DUF885 family protein [Pseudodesulfovibrio sp.]|nr:DUF885 family protein [Pseudodesulfovibrio sp.]
MPPALDASKHLDRLDDLSRKGITKHIAKLTDFKKDFLAAESNAPSLEAQGQARALALCASGAISELGSIRTWEKNPEIYLKVAFLGLEQAAVMPAKSEKARQKRFIKRLKSVPDLLELAPANIEAISAANRAAAQTMVRDCARYLSELKESELGKTDKTHHLLAEVLSALKDFDRFATACPEIQESEGTSFGHMTANILGTDRTPDEIFAIAEDEFNRRNQSLRWLESEIGNGSNWEKAHDAYIGPDIGDMEAVDIIIREIHRLRGFLLESAIPGVFDDSPLNISQHPLHQASTMRPIHYAPALGAWEKETSHCYVNQQIFTGRGFRDNPTRLARIRREFIFMTARQTYPGRHLLDSQRRALGDSPMAQITNPLFTAGWLAFAENMLEELGYLENPLDRLVHHQRGLRRAALAMIDAGLATGNMNQDTCLALLNDAGFSKDESLNRLRSIRLMPAYRTMPVLGLHELTTLRNSSKMELDQFCKTLFAGGQLPFQFITPRMHD